MKGFCDEKKPPTPEERAAVVVLMALDSAARAAARNVLKPLLKSNANSKTKNQAVERLTWQFMGLGGIEQPPPSYLN
jgi:hypothetical protein